MCNSVNDLKNIGDSLGGIRTSSLFLKHFTDYPWTHFDIEGVAFVNEAKGYPQRGVRAVLVWLVYEFVKKRSKYD